MTIELVTFGPVKIDGEWFCRLRTPDGRSTETGPFDSEEDAQRFTDRTWPGLLEELRQMEGTGALKVHSVTRIDGEAP